MSNEQTLTFDDLNLKFGQIVQIHPIPKDGNIRFDCLLVGCLPGESIIVSAPPGTGKFPQVEEGQQVVIRVMSANGVALFSTTVLYISDVPVFMVYLDFPRAVKFKLVRNSTRVDVALPILASNCVRTSIRGVAGKIADISTSGARIEVSEKLGAVGEEVELKGKFQVGDIQRVSSFKATIRSVTQEGGNYIYGLQIHEGDEDKLLVLFGYIFNSMAFGNVQTVG